MAKVQTNGNMKVAWILEADLTNPEFPSATELNADALDLSSAISWEDYELGSSGSDDIDDRALTDLGSAVSRGNANYSATLDFFRDLNNQEAASVYVDAFEAFRTTRITGYLVTRVAEKAASAAWAAGDNVSIYKMITSYTADMTTGDASTKFQVNFLSQGILYTNTMVASASAVLGIPATASLSLATGDREVLLPTLDGKSIRGRATYVSANEAIATVSNHGIVVPVAVGGPVNITVSYGASSTPDVCAVTVTA